MKLWQNCYEKLAKLNFIQFVKTNLGTKNPVQEEFDHHILDLLSAKDFDQAIYKHRKTLDWAYVIRCKNFTERHAVTYCHRMDWNFASSCMRLSESTLRKFSKHLNWLQVSRHQKLSESFIRYNKDNLNWYEICCKQILSESFIEEMAEYVDWKQLSYSQNLSPEFIRKYSDKLDLRRLMMRLRHTWPTEFITELNQRIMKGSWAPPKELEDPLKNSIPQEIEKYRKGKSVFEPEESTSESKMFGL